MEHTDVDTGSVSTSSCSGNVVTSANRSVVLTAAHRLRIHTPLDIGFGNVVATNMVFVSAFDGTNLPRDPSGTGLPDRDIAPATSATTTVPATCPPRSSGPSTAGA